MIRVTPGGSFEATIEVGTTGLVGTIGVRIINLAGATILGRVTAGIVEDLSGSGIYAVVLTAPGTAGPYEIVWDTGGALSPANTGVEDLIVDPVALNCYAVQQGAAFNLGVKGPTGVAGTMGVQIVDNIGNVVVARRTGAAEFPSGSGIYHISMGVVPALVPGRYGVIWDTGTVSPTTVAVDDLVIVPPVSGVVSTGSGEQIPASLFLCNLEVVNPARAFDYLRTHNTGRF
jgi:hypothetical protein